MGADWLGRNACFRAKRTDELEQPHTRQMLLARGKEIARIRRHMGDMALYRRLRPCRQRRQPLLPSLAGQHQIGLGGPNRIARKRDKLRRAQRSEEHTPELQSLMRNSYAVFCLKKKKNTTPYNTTDRHTNTTLTNII